MPSNGRTEADLLSWAIEHAGARSITKRERWSAVGELFGLGSGSASVLCREYGHDPHELVGGECECECGAYVRGDGDPQGGSDG